MLLIQFLIGSEISVSWLLSQVHLRLNYCIQIPYGIKWRRKKKFNGLWVCENGSRTSFQAHQFGVVLCKNTHRQADTIRDDLYDKMLFFSTSLVFHLLLCCHPSTHCTLSPSFCGRYNAHYFFFFALSDRLLITGTQFHWQVADSREKSSISLNNLLRKWPIEYRMPIHMVWLGDDFRLIY